MIEHEKGPKIRKTPPTRNPACYQTQHDIVIPAGTVLRNVAGTDDYSAPLGLGNTQANLSITVKPGVILPAGTLKRVVA